MYSRRGRHGDAVPLLRAAVAALPGNADLQFELANGLYLSGAYDEAGAAFARLAQLEPGDARWQWWRATNRFLAGDAQSALAVYRDATTKYQRRRTVLLRYLAASLGGGETDIAAAKALMTKTLAGREKTVEGRLYQYFLKSATLEQVFAVAATPAQQCQAHVFGGYGHLLAGDKQQAVERLDAALEICPTDKLEYRLAHAERGRPERRGPRRALDNPGRWRPGKIALGAKPREYVPSDDELLVAELGGWLVQLVERMGRREARERLSAAGIDLAEIVFEAFSFSHADVMGGGRFFYASAPRAVRVILSPEAKMPDDASHASNAVTGSAFFSSPRQAVEEIRELLRRKDWPALARYYDLTGSTVDPETLASGAFFWREERPEMAHPGGFWRYRHPFAPSFNYQAALPTADPSIVTVQLTIVIDQGVGSPPQQGQQEFRMRESADGFQVLPD